MGQWLLIAWVTAIAPAGSAVLRAAEGPAMTVDSRRNRRERDRNG